MKEMRFAEAICEAIAYEMRRDKNVFLLGEDVSIGVFGVTKKLFKEFGPSRVMDTPISEEAIAGAAVGAAATGLRPIAEIMFMDFITVAMDEIVNQAAKMRYMFGGKITLPLIIRCAAGAGIQGAAQHSQSLEAWLVHTPGLKVAYPSTPNDAIGLYLSAIRDDNPTIVIENKMLYASKGMVDEEFSPIPFGKADIKKEGSDVTVIATGVCVLKALECANKLEGEGISCEVIDPRTLFPFDKETIFNSIKKTNRVVIVTEENRRGAFSAEISALIAEEAFDNLDAPIVRIGSINTPVPFSKVLEDYYLPSTSDIEKGIKSFF
ncbi:MAG: alpha-ketoacid dehydrogenase subunit beta [Deferribacterota bacterium]|nr:alpha-ketoacid dehydrogenase subunit beta [Deferribacterota bacterium]